MTIATERDYFYVIEWQTSIYDIDIDIKSRESEQSLRATFSSFFNFSTINIDLLSLFSLSIHTHTASSLFETFFLLLLQKNATNHDDAFQKEHENDSHNNNVTNHRTRTYTHTKTHSLLIGADKIRKCEDRNILTMFSQNFN